MSSSDIYTPVPTPTSMAIAGREIHDMSPFAIFSSTPVALIYVSMSVYFIVCVCIGFKLARGVVRTRQTLRFCLTFTGFTLLTIFLVVPIMLLIIMRACIEIMTECIRNAHLRQVQRRNRRDQNLVQNQNQVRGRASEVDQHPVITPIGVDTNIRPGSEHNTNGTSSSGGSSGSHSSTQTGNIRKNKPLLRPIPDSEQLPRIPSPLQLPPPAYVSPSVNYHQGTQTNGQV